MIVCTEDNFFRALMLENKTQTCLIQKYLLLAKHVVDFLDQALKTTLIHSTQWQSLYTEEAVMLMKPSMNSLKHIKRNMAMMLSEMPRKIFLDKT